MDTHGAEYILLCRHIGNICKAEYFLHFVKCEALISDNKSDFLGEFAGLRNHNSQVHHVRGIS